MPSVSFADHAVAFGVGECLQQLEVIDFKSDKRKRIEFPEPVYSAGFGSQPRVQYYGRALQL